MLFPYLKWTKRQIEPEDISVLGLDCDHWQRALLRLVGICHCAQALLFSSSKWYPFRWVLLQISWLPILFTSAQLPLLWDMLDAIALPLNSSLFESLWHRTQQASDSIMFNKQAANMSPAENHFNIIPICEWLWESSISVLMKTTEFCSHCYALPLICRWTHNLPKSRRDLGLSCSPLGLLGIEKRGEIGPSLYY